MSTRDFPYNINPEKSNEHFETPLKNSNNIAYGSR